MLPESNDVKESLLRMMRLSTISATSTTAASIMARIQSLASNQAIPPKKPAHIFPEFVAATATNADQPTQGQCDFPTRSLRTGLGPVSGLDRDKILREPLS